MIMESFIAVANLDGVVLVYLALIVPVWGLIDNKIAARRRKKGIPPNRLARYNRLFLELWVPTLIVLALWVYTGRSWEALGIGFEITTLSLAGYGFTLLAVAYLFMSVWQVHHDEKARAMMRAELEGSNALDELMPSTQKEFYRFRVLAVTAGITEEILFRGFLYWVLSPVVGGVVASLLTIVAFTLGHLYQERPSDIIRVAITGAVLIALYVSTGSLIAPIILHIVIDWTSNDMAWRARAEINS